MSAPSIPALNNYQFAIPAYNGNALNVGSKIKDQRDGSETITMREQSRQVTQATADFVTATNTYKEQHLSASKRAEEAKQEISSPLKNKAIAITLLVTAIILVIAPIIAAVLTGTWAFALLALPFLIALVPASHYTHIFRKSVSQLESDIAAPKALPVPVKRVIAPYVAANDLDLRTSRISAINQLSSKTLREINNSRFSIPQIVDYALLDGTTTPHHRAEFYSRSVYLMNTLNELDRLQGIFDRSINTEFDKFASQLRKWHAFEELQISFEESYLRQDEQQRIQNQAPRQPGQPAPSLVRTVLSNVDLAIRKGLLESRKREFYTLHGRLTAEINAWRTQSVERVRIAYQDNVMRLENAYFQTKLAAQDRIVFTRM